jgi:hypothetical protein
MCDVNKLMLMTSGSVIKFTTDDRDAWEFEINAPCHSYSVLRAAGSSTFRKCSTFFKDNTTLFLVHSPVTSPKEGSSSVWPRHAKGSDQIKHKIIRIFQQCSGSFHNNFLILIPEYNVNHVDYPAKQRDSSRHGGKRIC